MELNTIDPDAIDLPDWIAQSTLSLSEIGAVVVMACVSSTGDASMLSKDGMAEALVSLKELGVFNPQILDSGTLDLSLNLDAVNPT